MRSRAEDAYPPCGGLVPLSDGGRLHVFDTGPKGSGAPPIVLVHGADGVVQEFTETIVPALATGLRVLAVDRPGHGWSTPPSAGCGIAANMEAIREGVRALGVERAVVVGHSYGAAIAVRWALEHPEEVAGLVLLAPAAHFRWPRVTPHVLRIAETPRLAPALAEALVPLLGPLAHALSARWAFRPNPVPPAFRAFGEVLYLRPAQTLAVLREYRRLRDDLGEQEGRYGEIAVPTLVLVGAEDPVTVPRLQAEPLAREVPGAELRVLPGLGHEFHWHAPDEVVKAVREVAGRAREGATPSA